MKISSGLEQSIYVLLLLSRLPKGKTLSSIAISQRLDVSHSYLKKIVKSLVHEGLVNSTPGKNGGFSLSRPLDKINLYQVFTAVEGKGSIFNSQYLIKDFIEGSDNGNEKECVISQVMDTVEQKLRTSLQSVLLSQILKNIENIYDIGQLDKWINEVITKPVD
ncbi:Rrf2 family transcriptional regulator [Lentilactobacillus raoultii]|uniref:Rrf2 family transcriptional regulator n=1 Tax=Lentilactobacillus raoultii TaxID=1987503 RepID=A0ABW3PFQ0_9LACO|nr:Rrf2 family transcriptional regulator [Lentilactobacillus raoultii]